MSDALPATSEPLGDFAVMSLPNQIHKDVKTDFLYKGFHSGPVDSMDICMQKPLMVTSSRDECKIRIWNYVDKKCEYSFPEKIIPGQDDKLERIAVHPFSYFMAAAYESKLVFYHILKDKLR